MSSSYSKPPLQGSSGALFHRCMAVANITILVISIFGCKLTSIHVDIHKYGSVLFMALIMIGVLFCYWDEAKQSPRMQSILVIPWILLLIPLLMFPMLIAARMRMPLQDAHLARIDELLRINSPEIVAWAAHHWIGMIINKTYILLGPLLAAAVLAPALSGKVDQARQFIFANLMAITVGMPMFALVPAIGPWSSFHFTPTPAQAYCQAQFLALRVPGTYTLSQMAAVVCFPSFHTVWAILCAAALWTFRPLRIPLTILSTLIILSTMTTGWHYFVDVLAGIAVACMSLAFANAWVRSLNSAVDRQTSLPQQSQPAEVTP